MKPFNERYNRTESGAGSVGCWVLWCGVSLFGRLLGIVSYIPDHDRRATDLRNRD